MANHDAFALSNSPFNEFLYAEVGIEENGSELTVLSLLARLGEDPWSAVAKWSALPRSKIVDLLVAGMARMPLSAQAQADARATAGRVTLLLPKVDVRALASDPTVSRVPRWLPMAAFYCAIAIGMAINGAIITSHASDPAPVAPATSATAPGAPSPK